MNNLFDYIGTGYALDDFLSGFPSVTRAQALRVLEWQSEQTKRAMA